MRLLIFLVARSWRHHGLRTVLTVLGIALGVAIVTAIHVMDHNTIRSQMIAAEGIGGEGVDFELVPRSPGIDASSTREELLAIDGVAAAAILQESPVELVVAERPVGVVTMVGIGPLPAPAFDYYTVAEGRDLRGLDGEGAVLIGAELAHTLGVRPGDTLTLRPAVGEPRRRCIDGRLVADDGDTVPAVEPLDVEVAGTLAPHHLGRRQDGRVVIVPWAIARRLAPRGLPTFHVAARYGADRDQLRSALEKHEFVVHDDSAALLGESADERAFRNGVKVLGGLALVLGMFVVFQTLSQSLVERMRQIGLLRSLGASGATVASVFLVDAFALAIAGVAVGLLLGLLLAFVLQQLHFSSLGMLKHWEFHELPARPLLWTAALGILFTLSGAAFPLWRARKLSALRVLHARGLGADTHDVLRGVNRFLFALLAIVLPIGYLAMTTILSANQRETQLVLLQIGGLILVFGAVLLLAPGLVRVLGRAVVFPLQPFLRLPTFLVRKTLQRQTGRVAASVCGLAIVLVAGIALESLTSALHADARAFGRRAMPNTLFMRGDPTDARTAQALVDVTGVRSVEAMVGPVRAPFNVSGLDLATLTRSGEPLADDPVAARRYTNERTLVVSERLARLQRLHIGDVVPLITDGGAVDYSVIAIDDRAGYFPDDRVFALADPRWLAKDFCRDHVERVILRLDPGADTETVRAAVRRRRPDFAWSKSGDGIVAYLLRDTTRDFRLFQILLVLILVLGGVGLVNSMTISALGRVREIGVLRALGTSRRQLRQALLVEGLLTGGLAALVAVVLGVPLGRLIVHGMNQVAGVSAPYVVPWHAIIAAPIAALVVGVFAALVPGSRIARIEPARAVRFE